MKYRIASFMISLFIAVHCAPESESTNLDTNQPTYTTEAIKTTKADDVDSNDSLPKSTKRFLIPGLENIKGAADSIRDSMKDFIKDTMKFNNTNPDNEQGDEPEQKQVCYRQVGCFSMEEPWKSVLRPISAPLPPDQIDPFIRFYSRQNPKKEHIIELHPHIKTNNANIDPQKITTFIVHGFSSYGNASWMLDMKDVYLKKFDANVMLVDWGKGAKLFNYLQVAGNTRVVGKLLGMFLKKLVNETGVNPKKVHLIGHSLGAQICSYISKQVPNVGRLTALDPAQPGFEGFSKVVRLDKGDADFVDVIHTDAKPIIPLGGFGTITPAGHIDFYMNGGFEQPGCLPPIGDMPKITNILDLAKYPVELISKMVSCPHGRAHQYLIEAFNETSECVFWGHKVNFKNVFQSVTNTLTQGLIKGLVSLSKTCTKENCVPLGFATRTSSLRGSFVVTTSAKPPYCIPEAGIPPEIPSNPSAGKQTTKLPNDIGLRNTDMNFQNENPKSPVETTETLNQQETTKTPSKPQHEEPSVNTNVEETNLPVQSKPTSRKEPSADANESTEPMRPVTSAPTESTTRKSSLIGRLSDRLEHVASFVPKPLF